LDDDKYELACKHSRVSTLKNSDPSGRIKTCLLLLFLLTFVRSSVAHGGGVSICSKMFSSKLKITRSSIIKALPLLKIKSLLLSKNWNTCEICLMCSLIVLLFNQVLNNFKLDGILVIIVCYQIISIKSDHIRWLIL
jgi:hypothetical protein